MGTQRIRHIDGLLMQLHDPASGPILPKIGEKNVLITSALPYVNNVPHLGNIIGYVTDVCQQPNLTAGDLTVACLQSVLSADVFARYNRTLNHTTLFVCGNDEYGTAVETKAREEGVPPHSITSNFHQLHAGVYKWFGIEFDAWGRTATPKHTELTQEMYKNIRARGFLSLETSDQPYCEEDEMVLADRFVDGTCPRCGNKDARGDQCDKCLITFSSAASLLQPRCKLGKTHRVTSRPSRQACLRLDKVQPELEKWMRQAQMEGKWRSNPVITEDGEIVEPRLLGNGLGSAAISRDLKWGVKVPLIGDDDEDAALEGKVLFVWFDAPIGYHSITAAYTDRWQEWWMNPDNVQLYQFMGKDNVFFHTVLFPAMLLADGRIWTMPHNISSTHHLYYEGEKFSKSKNVGVFANNAEQSGQPASVWRYYLLSQRPEDGNSTFNWSGLIDANNEDLLGNLDHFVYRTIHFVNVHFDSIVPGLSGDFSVGASKPTVEMDVTFIRDVDAHLREYREHMGATRLRDGLSTAMAISARGNQYLDDTALAESLLASDPDRCPAVTQIAVNVIYIFSVVLHPFIPTTTTEILNQLNAPARTLPSAFAIDILPGHAVGEAEHLFKEIGNLDGAQEKAWRKHFGRASAV